MRRWILPLATALLAAGCAAPDRGGQATDRPFDAREAATAFGVICDTPRTDEAIGRAAGFGYRVVPRQSLPPALRDLADRQGATVLARPGERASTLTLDDTPHCEMLLIGQDLAALEHAFTVMLREGPAARGIPVALGTPEQAAQLERGQGLRVRQFAVLGAEGGPQRFVSLRTSPDGTRAVLVSRAIARGTPARKD